MPSFCASGLVHKDLRSLQFSDIRRPAVGEHDVLLEASHVVRVEAHDHRHGLRVLAWLPIVDGHRRREAQCRQQPVHVIVAVEVRGQVVEVARLQQPDGPKLLLLETGSAGIRSHLDDLVHVPELFVGVVGDAVRDGVTRRQRGGENHRR